MVEGGICVVGGEGVVRFVTSHKSFCVCFAPFATLQKASVLVLEEAT